MVFGQPSTVASDLGQGYALGREIGDSMRERREEKRRNREVSRILARMGKNTSSLPDERDVQALMTVAGPEFANQWLSTQAQVGQMRKDEQDRSWEKLTRQSQFEMAWRESLMSLPPEQRAQKYVEDMERFMSDPATQEMAISSFGAFAGGAMNGQPPDFSDQALMADLTRNRHFMDGVNIYKDQRALDARMKELGAAAGEAAADREAEAVEAETQRAFDADQNQRDRESREKIAMMRADGEAQGMTHDEQARSRQAEFGGRVEDWMILLDPRLNQHITEGFDENGPTGKMMFNGRELDLGSFTGGPQLPGDDPLARSGGGGGGGTVRRTALPAWLGADEP
ncbi:MAG: hypothetical protein OXC91_15180 [Rhodobacteraceae bacterium]|nr:hypothetical protein [Paracoccaceae bacterium]